ncbi:MAG: ComEC family competence protein [Cytophagaceae bacterium]|nr:ComEC family competence protein [Cytophagaceae bacterium]
MFIKWSSFPFFRFTLAFSGGILFYIHSTFEFNPFPVLIALLAAYIFLYFFTFRKDYFHPLKPFLGFTGLSMLFFFGYLYANRADETKNPDHIYQCKNKIQYYTVHISGIPQQKEKTYKTEANIRNIKTENGWQRAEGKIILYIDKKNFQKLSYGDILLVKGSPEETKAPANPEEFDYKKYLYFNHILHQDFIKAKDYSLIQHNPDNLVTLVSFMVSEEADHSLRKFISGDNEYKIASALILGIKNNIENDLKNAYSSTGTMHILAVSGLHVALILQILSISMGWMTFSRKTKKLLPFAIIILLWFYAFITGLSASVLRAVLMFSLIILAKAFERNTNIYNTLACSAFILLLCDPFFIMDVGFQLSYIAVLGIVYFHPRIYAWYKSKNYWYDKIWMITSVSIAAQLATFPLGLLYFHQFPLSFLLSNLIAIPLSFFVLYLGVILLIFQWVPVLNSLTGWLTEKLIWLMNKIILLIEQIPFSAITNIDIDIAETILIYAFIIFTAAFFFFKKLRYAMFCFMIVATLSAFQVSETIQKRNQKKVIVFNIKNHFAIGFINGNEIYLISDSTLLTDPAKIKFHMEPYLIKNGIENIHHDPLQKLNSSMEVNFEGKNFLISHKSLMIAKKKIYFNEMKKAVEINLSDL